MAARRGFGAAAEPDFVLDRYEEVIEVNPSNIQAWANTGYLHWMIGNTAAAREAYARGLEYKEIARQTVVSELRFGLARICAEEGESRRGLPVLPASNPGKADSRRQFCRSADHTGDYSSGINLKMIDRLERFKDTSSK